MLQYSNVHHNFEAMYAIINLVEKFLTNKFDSKNKKICTYPRILLSMMNPDKRPLLLEFHKHCTQALGSIDNKTIILNWNT